ncbi:hypothetical protein CCACVL1_03284 [Corchorus capsularis]|uniref:Uncharacterized protein n=1 Tax=Corchorus capsularis TaxID=210143 RepID=A0A1R3K185_COCAP|nr:hypothetical protein CCACVL1_03284 [Corchorus capsularis]
MDGGRHVGKNECALGPIESAIAGAPSDRPPFVVRIPLLCRLRSRQIEIQTRSNRLSIRKFSTFFGRLKTNLDEKRGFGLIRDLRPLQVFFFGD